MNRTQDLGKLIKLTGDRAKLDAKATMFMFAGNNGSGKITIRNLIIDKLGVV